MKKNDGSYVDKESFMISGNKFEGTLYIEDENNVFTYVEQPSTAYIDSYYVEDESNVGTYTPVGDQYNGSGGTNVYTISGGVTCYETEAVTFTGGYTTIYILNNGIYSKLTGHFYNMSGKTYYNRSNGATRYKVSKVSTALYTKGSTRTYPLYKKVSKKLYEEGTRKTRTMYKEYTSPLYSKGDDVVFTKASFVTRDTTVLKV